MFNKINKFLPLFLLLISVANAQEFSAAQCLKDMEIAALSADQASAKILSPQTYKKASTSKNTTLLI